VKWNGSARICRRRKKKISELQGELKDAQKQHREALENVSKLSEEEAKVELKRELEEEFSGYFAQQVKA
jgi:hypothetical protein